MTITEFRQQLKSHGLDARKQRGLEVCDIIRDGTELCAVTYAEIYRSPDVQQLLAKKLRPEYIPPLG